MSERSDKGRRHLLTADDGHGCIGGVAFAVPFLASWKPSARAQALGAPVEIDISKLEPGGMLKIEWRGKPVLIVRRTPEMLASSAATTTRLADPGSQELRSSPNYARTRRARSSPSSSCCSASARTSAVCRRTASPGPSAELLGADWPGGFFCPCHGSKFDLAGPRVQRRAGAAQPEVPPYRFVDDTTS